MSLIKLVGLTFRHIHILNQFGSERCMPCYFWAKLILLWTEFIKGVAYCTVQNCDTYYVPSIKYLKYL